MTATHKRIITAILCILAVIVTVYTFAVTENISAYFTDKDTKDNVLSVGCNTIEIIEDYQPPEELKAGISFHKDVRIKNTGECSCYARVKAVFTDFDIMPYCTIDYNTNDFVYNETDGYYYCKKSLAKGEISDSLMTTVTISNDVPSENLKDFDILLYAESYQAYGSDNYETAWQNFQRNKSLI